MENKLTGYELSRNFFDWAFENPEKINPSHIAIYFFATEHQNRLGGKCKFGFPTQMVMDALGIKKYQTYIKYFNELVEWGFFILVEKSKNQYSANIISINSAMPKNGKALDKAFIKHGAKQTESNGQSTGQSKDSIDKQDNNKQINNNTIDFDIFLDWFNKTTNRNFKSIPEATKKSFKARLKEGYTKEDIMKAVINCSKDKFHIENPKYLTPEFISRADKLAMYFEKTIPIITNNFYDSQNPKSLPVEL